MQQDVGQVKREWVKPTSVIVVSSHNPAESCNQRVFRLVSNSGEKHKCGSIKLAPGQTCVHLWAENGQGNAEGESSIPSEDGMTYDSDQR